MQQSSLFIIQCIAFAVLIFAVFYYFNKKTQYLMSAIESLQNQILDQQKILEGHDKMFRHLLGAGIPEISTTPVRPIPMRPVVTRPHSPPPVESAPQPSSPIMDMAPMMSNILGVIGSMTGGNLGGSMPQMEIPEPLSKFDENEINMELSKELAELELAKKEDLIKEGRIENPEPLVVAESTVEE
jgi:hypothetical protein